MRGKGGGKETSGAAESVRNKRRENIKNPTQASSGAGLQRSPLGMNFNFAQEFCSFVNYFQMKREIFLRRVSKGPRQHLNFKGEAVCKENRRGEKGGRTWGGERGWRRPLTATALLGTRRGLQKKPWRRILILFPGNIVHIMDWHSLPEERGHPG